MSDLFTLSASVLSTSILFTSIRSIVPVPHLFTSSAFTRFTRSVMPVPFLSTLFASTRFAGSTRLVFYSFAPFFLAESTRSRKPVANLFTLSTSVLSACARSAIPVPSLSTPSISTSALFVFFESVVPMFDLFTFAVLIFKSSAFSKLVIILTLGR